MKAIYTFIDNNGQERKEEIKGVTNAFNNRVVQYPNGEWYTSFVVQSRIEDCMVRFDLVPGSKLEFSCD